MSSHSGHPQAGFTGNATACRIPGVTAHGVASTDSGHLSGAGACLGPYVGHGGEPFSYGRDDPVVGISGGLPGCLAAGCPDILLKCLDGKLERNASEIEKSNGKGDRRLPEKGMARGRSTKSPR